MEGLLQCIGNTNENKKIIANIDYILTWALQSSKYFTYEATEEYQKWFLIKLVWNESQAGSECVL